MSSADFQIEGWVLYDDACGFCRKWIPFWAATLRKRGFDITPLQSGWLRDHPALSKVELLDDLRLLVENGVHIQGADVYRHLMRRIWWAWPVYLFSIAPLTRSLFDWIGDIEPLQTTTTASQRLAACKIDGPKAIEHSL
jgi:predicted DCC family thiol-disulfide oxidoreductase YuxK